EIVIFDCRQSSHDADGGTTVAPAGGRAAQLVDVDPQRHDDELLPPPDAELLVNLAKLLLAQHDESIAVEASQHPLNENEEARFPPAVVTVKDMAVVRVYESAAARRQRDEAVQETGGTSDRSRLCCVRVHDVRLKADHQPPEPPYRQQIARRKLAAHRGNHERRDAVR